MTTDTERKEPSLLRLFGTFVVILLVASGVGYAAVRATLITADESAESKRETTRLEERINSAREIRAALSKPQPPIPPLPPITAKLAHQLPKPTKVVGMDNKKPIRLPKEARDAFAMEPQSYGRGGGRTYDRAGVGGW
jgi:hypothetical protein